MISARAAREAGFSFIEVLIASAITAAITLLAATFAIEAHVSWRADSARVDLQQRTRAVVDYLTRLLREAGLGPHGHSGTGGLIRVLAPVLPRRTGSRGATAPEVFKTDAVTIIRALPDAEQAVLLLDAPPGATVLQVGSSPPCALPACGYSEGMHVLLFDAGGNHDIFTVTSAEGSMLAVRHHGSGTAVTYPAGSPVAPVESLSLHLDAGARLLRAYDGDSSDLPLVDEVVGMEVEYYGDSRPPRWPRPGPGAANCLYSGDGSYNVVSMPVLAAPAGLVALSPVQLTDGPWCGTGANQFDADLLRVRRIRIRLRLQAADPAVRGRDARLFRDPGIATRPAGMVPDAAAVIDVAPPNLAQGW